MIIIFKTSVLNKSHISKLKPHLDNVIKNGKWNFDLEDCDKILRIESEIKKKKKVISLLDQHEFECVELED